MLGDWGFYTYDLLSFEQFTSLVESLDDSFTHCSPFTLPQWCQLWHSLFGQGRTPFLLAISLKSALLGIAPLCRQEQKITLMGDEDLCDYLDMYIKEGKEKPFLAGLLYYLHQRSIEYIQLGALHPGSIVYKHLPSTCDELPFYSMEEQFAGNIYTLKLPSDWSGYLTLLTNKHRHELRRKIRRVKEKGCISYRAKTHTDWSDESLELFFQMFSQSRDDKERFLTPDKKNYFNKLAKWLISKNRLHLGELIFNGEVVACVFCFIWKDSMYLYNNGFHPAYSDSSVGFISKIFNIRHTIEEGYGRYNFLKGDERYKRHLGGKPEKLSRFILVKEKDDPYESR